MLCCYIWWKCRFALKLDTLNPSYSATRGQWNPNKSKYPCLICVFAWTIRAHATLKWGAKGLWKNILAWGELLGETEYTLIFCSHQASTSVLLCVAGLTVNTPHIIVWLPVLFSLVSTLQAQLASRKMDKSITHQAVVQLSEVISAPLAAKDVTLWYFSGLTCHPVILPVGCCCTETRNNPLKKEIGTLHGPCPGRFVNLGLYSRKHFENDPEICY